MALGRWVWNTRRAIAYLRQRRGKPFRMTADFGANAVRLIFAATADRHLHERRRHGRQDHDRKGANYSAAIPVAAEEHREIREHGDRAGDGRCDRHGQRVAVFHVSQLVGHDARKLVFVQDLQNACGRGDGGVFRVAARCKRVRLFILDDVDLRAGHVGVSRHMLDIFRISADGA